MIYWFAWLSAGTAAAYLAARRTKRMLHMLSTRYPHFVYADVGIKRLGVPVFTYHSVAPPDTPDSVTPEAFERHMRYLVENGYHTLHADELYDYMVNGQPVPGKSVMITFDDGRATLWTVAFPILKRYGLKAVSFVVPGSMIETGVRPVLERDGVTRGASVDSLLNADLSPVPAITWDEARIMHDSGLIDIQSHTLEHALIYYTSEIVDFVHPGFDAQYNNYALPLISYEGIDQIRSPLPAGTPIYRYQTRMSSARRFFDDEDLRRACVDHVSEQGQTAFFARLDWRASLLYVAEKYRARHTLVEYVETAAEQSEAIRYSLEGSKRQIEEHLPGHIVQHLCYPWNRYSMLAASLARNAGYQSAFIDVNPQKLHPNWNNPYAVQRTLPTNEYGDDPFQITRIDARDDIVQSLPGKGRLSYMQRLFGKLFRRLGVPGGRM